jgi:invasion protein IalB
MRRVTKCLIGTNMTRLVTLAVVMFATLSSSRIAFAADTPGAIDTPWRKVCFKDERTEFKKVCSTRAEARKKEDESLLASVELIEREDDPKKVIRVTFPLGMQLVYGTRLLIYGIDEQKGMFIQCTAAGCMSEYEATPALLGCMRVGLTMLVRAIDQSGKPLDVTISLSDFWVAYDGRRTNDI